ncbi:ADP-ribosylglycohydrolase family protein [Nocardiopsis sp. NRRL B-16309]|uniref:ADP-ribosylglycohydrolase family protein n=1 Tax=Nocardiopsis sp. NRRL B-16309 TaxID=1519494 RepID=UPI0006AE6CD8|nr:ADP-ribosylglycohydrolase family protein [Nocardiopsis sp. NRRL B-16309]KOX13863.1 crystallin [Nocardiopsis sp. NRRL B-16309]
MTPPPPGTVGDRAAGVLLGAACGDALGVPYEFARRLGDHEVPEMVGGGLGPYAPGEYSDDTQMAVCIAEALRDHDAPLSDRALRQTAEAFLAWRRDGASDIGHQTQKVLGEVEAARGTEGVAEQMAAHARRLFESGLPSAGNGSLMRTGPLALAYLDDPAGLAVAADRYSRLTHGDPLASEACVLWCEGVRRAVVRGDLSGVRAGVELLPMGRQASWAAWLDEAEERPPHAFEGNGFVVRALQAAWSAVSRGEAEEEAPGAGDAGNAGLPTSTEGPRLQLSRPAAHQRPEGAARESERPPSTEGLRLQRSLWSAVRAGNDTDTVAAIAGALLGARYGASAIPDEYLSVVHGWPGYRAADLAALALAITERHS